MQRAVQLSIRAVIFKEHDRFVAQGIEYDICASADSITALMGVFVRRIAGNVAINAQFGRAGLEGVKPAPERFMQMFDEAGVDMSPVHPVGVALPSPTAKFRYLEQNS